MASRHPSVPPPGVSAIGGSPVAPPTSHVRPARTARAGDEVLKNVQDMRRVAYSGVDGDTDADVDIREVPLPGHKSERGVILVPSVDGKTYKFRIRDRETGKPLPERTIICLYIAIRELMLGGNPLDVFDAFKVRLPDLDKQQLLPIIRSEPEVSDVGDLELGD